MKTVKYLTAVLAGTFIYVLFSVSFGRNGFWAFNQLEEQKRVISAHTQNIQNINDELNLERTAIANDMDVIAAYARKLDYVFPDEKLVKINGLGEVRSSMYESGTVLKHKPVAFVPEWVCKACGLVITGLLFILMFLYDISQGNISFKKKDDVETIQGIPVYDMPQI